MTKQLYDIAVCDDVQTDREETARLTEEICKAEGILPRIARFERAEALLETIQGGDLHKGIDRVVTDRVKQSFELVGVVIAGLIALLLRKLNELTRIRLKDTIFYGFIQRLVDDVLVLPQGGNHCTM